MSLQKRTGIYAALAVSAATATLVDAQQLPLGLTAETGTWILSADPASEFKPDQVETFINGGVSYGQSHGEIVHMFKSNGQTVFKLHSNGGSITTLHYKDGVKYQYSHTNPQVFKDFDPCKAAGIDSNSDIREGKAGTSCAQLQSYFAELIQEQQELLTTVNDCQVTITDPAAAEAYGVHCPSLPVQGNLDLAAEAQYLGPDSVGNLQWGIPAPAPAVPIDAPSSVAAPDQTVEKFILYKETPEGKPVSFGDYHVLDFQPVVNDPSVFEINPNCLEIEIICPDGTVISAPPPGGNSSNGSGTNCSAPAKTWSPTAEELDDSNCHGNNKKWDNLLPPTRLWGTLWCGYGNEFSTIARWKEHHVSSAANINKVNRSGKDANYIKWGCGHEQVKDNKDWHDWTDGIHPVGEVMFGHYYPRNNQGIRLQTGPGSNRKLTFNYIKDRWVPTTISNYGIETDGVNGVFGNKYYNWNSVALNLSQSRLTRCRAMPNYIDPAFINFPASNNYNEGLHSQIVDSAFTEFTGLNWSPLTDNLAGTLTDDWCRRHDFCPVGQGETKQTCACDGAAEQATLEIDNSRFNPFIGIGKALFYDHDPVQGCWNLELKCFDYYQPQVCVWGVCAPTGFPYCVDYRVIWNRKEINKYNPSNDEGKKLWGPIAPDTYGQSKLCLSLRLPGEGIDGYNTQPKIGDGVCDCQFNNDMWGYDGGDCCPETCKGACAKFNCKQPGCKYSLAGNTIVPPYPAINARISGNDGKY